MRKKQKNLFSFFPSTLSLFGEKWEKREKIDNFLLPSFLSFLLKPPMGRQDCCICHKRTVDRNLPEGYTGPREAAVGHYAASKACPTCYVFALGHKKVRCPADRKKKVGWK